MLQLESGKAWVARNSISSDEFQSESHKSYRKDVSGYIGTDTLRCGSMLNCIMLIGSFWINVFSFGSETQWTHTSRTKWEIL